MSEREQSTSKGWLGVVKKDWNGIIDIGTVRGHGTTPCSACKLWFQNFTFMYINICSTHKTNSNDAVETDGMMLCEEHCW